MKRTALEFEGVSPDEVTDEFLVDLMDVAEDHGLDVDGIGVDRERSTGHRDG